MNSNTLQLRTSLTKLSSSASRSVVSACRSKRAFLSSKDLRALNRQHLSRHGHCINFVPIYSLYVQVYFFLPAIDFFTSCQASSSLSGGSYSGCILLTLQKLVIILFSNAKFQQLPSMKPSIDQMTPAIPPMKPRIRSTESIVHCVSTTFLD